MRRAWVTAAALLMSACGLPLGETLTYPAGSPELANASVSAEGIWQSAPWSGADVVWLPFPPQATIEVEHGLGRVPFVYNVYISFEEDGSGAAPASGDLARLISIDENFVAVRNTTNVELWARVTLQ